MEVVQIVESRGKVLLMLAGALVFVAIYTLLPDPNHQLPRSGGWFFGLGAAVSLVLLLRPRKLTLNSNGFSLSGGLVRKPKTIVWGDVTGFFPLSIPNMIGFNYSPDTKDKPRIARVSKRLAGADGGISGAWPCSNADLANQLNAYRERALTRR